MTFTFLIRPNSTYVLPRIKGTPQSEKEKQKTKSEQKAGPETDRPFFVFKITTEW